MQTPYQNVVITHRRIAAGVPDIHSLYINGRLQFASNDERVYHAYLTTPAMLASARTRDVLVIGGGDGLALRDILKWDPASVTLIDLDAQLVDLFAGRDTNAPERVSEALTQINGNAFNDPRVTVRTADAFIDVETLLRERPGQAFDVVVIDLPDPSHPDLNKLYTSHFYTRVRNLMSGDGAVTIQSTSPFHAKDAFLSIGKSLAHAGFQVDQYHANVPSFGEWGWTIGTLTGSSPKTRLTDASTATTPDGILNHALIMAAFEFTPGFYDRAKDVEINRLGSHIVYNYHQRAWQSLQGTFYTEDHTTTENAAH